MTRRDFTKAISVPALVSSPRARATARPHSLGIKLGSQAPAEPTDEDLAFSDNSALTWFIAVPPAFNSVEGVRSIQKRYADAGLRVHNVRNLGVTNNQADIILNRPARDQKIEAYKTWLRTIGRAGLHYTITNFNIAQIAISGFAQVRGSRDRDFDLNAPEMGIPGPTATGIVPMGSAKSLFFGREYTHDEIWANLTYFLEQVVPVAEEEGVVIGLHPDDPPVPSLFGVARVLTTFDSCKKALRFTGSPNVGLSLCCGTWAEGGKAMGIDTASAIRYFGRRKQIFEIHYRNVSAPLPHFHETYIDDGYYDMHAVMKALVDVKYDGIVHLDHFVPMVGGNRSYEGFVMGYMRAMLQPLAPKWNNPRSRHFPRPFRMWNVATPKVVQTKLQPSPAYQSLAGASANIVEGGGRLDAGHRTRPKNGTEQTRASAGLRLKSMIRIGPAGWSYKDWQGIVYPASKPKGFQELTYIFEFFDTVEIM